MSFEYDEVDELMDALYTHRKYAIDPECGHLVREEHWLAIDGILDRFNEIKTLQLCEDLNDL